jgi:hypothetical protein
LRAKSERSSDEVGMRRGRRGKREKRPREHGSFSQNMHTVTTVFCSTGTILRRKGNGDVLEVESSNGRRARKGKREKKADPFQNRKGRAPSMAELHTWIAVSVCPEFSAAREKPPGFSWPPARWRTQERSGRRGFTTSMCTRTGRREKNWIIYTAIRWHVDW